MTKTNKINNNKIEVTWKSCVTFPKDMCAALGNIHIKGRTIYYPDSNGLDDVYHLYWNLWDQTNLKISAIYKYAPDAYTGKCVGRNKHFDNKFKLVSYISNLLGDGEDGDVEATIYNSELGGVYTVRLVSRKGYYFISLDGSSRACMAFLDIYDVLRAHGVEG